MVTTTSPPSWYLDPTRRHEIRYWDGSRWTENVSDGGVPSVDRSPEEPVTDRQALPIPSAQRAVPPGFADAPDRAPWYRRRAAVIAATAVLVLAGLRIVAGGGGGGPPTTPAPPYPGALLGLEQPATGWHTVTELRSGGDPTERGTVWGTDVAGYENVWVSPDGTRAVSEGGTVTLLGAEPPMDAGLGHVYEVSFSPDGNRIAYTPAEGGTVRIFDIGTGATADVLQTPCETYGAFPAMMDVCGKADRALWVDGESLLVWHYAGAMPSEVDCYGQVPGIATDCSEPSANTYSIVSTSGAVLASVASDHTPLAVRGSTVLLAQMQWVDIADLRGGVMAPKPLPAGAIPGSLSPDGARVVVPGDPWAVVDIRSGTTTPLGTTEAIESNEPECFWSPDGQFLAVQGEGDVLVVPMSAKAGGWIGLTDFALIGWGT